MRALAFVLLICLLAPVAAAREQTYDVNSVEPGGLYFATATPGRVVRAPSLEAQVDITISGPVVHTRVVQRFTNPGDAWVEGLYTYPLPKGSAVDRLVMTVGERVIEGEIQEKAQAKRTYERAAAEGKRASIIVQKRPNIFSTRVANIGPGETIEILIEFQDLIAPRNNLFELRFPMVVRPRYVPGEPLDDRQARAGWGFDTDQVPDGSEITQPWVAGSAHGHNPVTLSVSLAAGFEIGPLMSPSHAVDIDDKGRTATVTLVGGSVPADQDFVLRWAPAASEAPQVGLFREATDKGDHSLLMLMPPSVQALEDAPAPRDLIIILDKSGSMGGQAIRQAKAAVRRALLRLKPHDSFNLIAFDSTPTALFASSRPASEANIELALDFNAAVTADGGTEMSDALALALPGSAASPDPERMTQIIFVTDGAVGNEAALMAQIKAGLGSARLFPVGIGSAPNSHFMSEAAHFGRGTYVNIAMSDSVLDSMARLFAKIERPQITNLALLGADGTADMLPETLPDLYDGEPVVVAFKGNADGAMTLRGVRGGRPWSMAVPVSTGGEAAGVANLWARRKIQSVNRAFIGEYGEAAQTARRDAVLDIALGYHLVSDFTSLVAVDKTPARPADAPAFKREVPANLPAGMDWDQRTVMTISAGLIAPSAQRSRLEEERLALVQSRATATPMRLFLMMGLLALLLAAISHMALSRRQQRPA